MAAATADNALSIFKDGKLKPGIYKIQNLYGQTYLDIHEHSKEWRIKPLEAGYSVQRVEPGKPAQFCVPVHRAGDKVHPILSVNPYPVAWRLEVVEDREHLGFEYVRFHWEPTGMVWDLSRGSSQDGTEVILYKYGPHIACRMWKLLPMNVEGAVTPSQSLSETLGSDSLPSYDRSTIGQSSTRTQHTEAEGGELGTVVNEVAVVTTTVTTRKRYRVEDV